MAETKASVKPSRAAKPSRSTFSAGRFELAIPEKVKVGVKEFKIGRDASRIFTLGGTLSAVSKTLGPFRGEIRHDDSGDLIATLDDVRVTVTRMTGQQGQSFLMYTLEYFVTSHGWRTGDGRTIILGPGHTGRDPYGAPQQVLFQNGAGGTMHTWFVGDSSFQLKCNDRRTYQLFHHAEHHALGWFDDWGRFTQYIHGPFFRC